MTVDRDDRFSDLGSLERISDLGKKIIDILGAGPEEGMTLQDIRKHLPDFDISKIAGTIWGVDLMGPGDIGTKGLVEFTKDRKFRLGQPSND